ncbi:MAG: hypothetical protein DWQ10_17010 [Calditrichaeota bacterium]|nr:MAG: hypothetical protein DWQ10_17010 [Calditrichota bacterium]
MLKFNSILSITALILSFSFYACDEDNPVNDDGDNDHAEAVGLVVLQSETEIVRYENGAVTGEITLKAGEATQLSVLFINDHDGELFSPDEDHHSLDWTVADQTIADLSQDGITAAWEFQVSGEKVGNTTVELKILHEDHADFVSLPIPIRVTQ